MANWSRLNYVNFKGKQIFCRYYTYIYRSKLPSLPEFYLSLVSSLSLSLFFCLSLASFQTAKRIVTVDSFHAGRKGNFWKPLLQCYVSFAFFIFFSIWFLLNSHLFCLVGFFLFFLLSSSFISFFVSNL